MGAESRKRVREVEAVISAGALPKELSLPPCVADSGTHGCELAGAQPAERRARSQVALSQVGELYRAYSKLVSPVEQGADADAAFRALLASTGGCAAARRLAAQLLPRFVGLAPPAQLDAAVGALVALCESPDVSTPLAAASVAAATAGIADLAMFACVRDGAESKSARTAASALLRLTAQGSPHAPDALRRTLLTGAVQAVLAALMLSFVSPVSSLREGARTWVANRPAGTLSAAAACGCPQTGTWFLSAVRAFKAGAPPALAAEAWPAVSSLLAAFECASDDDRAPLPHPAALAAASALAPLWSGTLLKGGAFICDAACYLPPTVPGAQPVGAGGDPLGWPSTLDMAQRVETSHVLQHLLKSVPARKRAVRRLAATSPSGTAALAELCAYLLERQRAGCIKLPAGGASGRARELYLLPAAPGVAAALGVGEMEGGGVWALLVPDEHHGSGHGKK